MCFSDPPFEVMLAVNMRITESFATCRMKNDYDTRLRYDVIDFEENVYSIKMAGDVAPTLPRDLLWYTSLRTFDFGAPQKISSVRSSRPAPAMLSPASESLDVDGKKK